MENFLKFIWLYIFSQKLCHRQPVYKVPVMEALHLAVSTMVQSANLQLALKRGEILLSFKS